MTVTVILPAARSQERAQEIVDKLRATNMAVLHHIVVCSPDFWVANAVNIHDSSLVGSSRVIARAYNQGQATTSDYVVWLSDICIPTAGCLINMVAAYTQPQPTILEFRTTPHPHGRTDTYRVCTILGKQYARWGMASQRTIKEIGGFFDEVYTSHYGDVDLSLRCWKAGGLVQTCKQAVIEMRGHTHPKDEPVLKADETTFLGRWQADYPGMRTDNTAEWNVDQELAL